MDPDESPETCAIRELKEETGYIGELVSDRYFQVSPIMFNGETAFLVVLIGSFIARPSCI